MDAFEGFTSGVYFGEDLCKLENNSTLNCLMICQDVKNAMLTCCCSAQFHCACSGMRKDVTRKSGCIVLKYNSIWVQLI